MNNEMFKRIVSDNSNHKFDPHIRLLCISGSNLQWLKMMINNHFNDCKSYNQELLKIKSSEPEEASLGIMGCRYEVMNKIEGIEEIKIYYNDVDITDYFLGTFEDIKTSNYSEGGPLGFAYLAVSLKGEKITDFVYHYVIECLEYVDTSDLDDYYEGCFDCAEEAYDSFVGETIKKNIFTICLFDESTYSAFLYGNNGKLTKKCNEILKKHFNVSSDEELIEKFEDLI